MHRFIVIMHLHYEYSEVVGSYPTLEAAQEGRREVSCQTTEVIDHATGDSWELDEYYGWVYHPARYAVDDPDASAPLPAAATGCTAPEGVGS